MNKKQIFGLLMIVFGIIAGLYVGIWVCFIGGIVGVISEVRAEHLSAVNVAISVAKVVLAGLAGWISAMPLIIPGFGMINMD